MIPNFTFLGKTFSAYMFLALAGVLVMLYFAWRAAKSQGLDELHMLNLLLFSMIGVLVGSHMLYGITNLPLLLALVGSLGIFDSWQAFWQALEAVFGYLWLTGAHERVHELFEAIMEVEDAT